MTKKASDKMQGNYCGGTVPFPIIAVAGTALIYSCWRIFNRCQQKILDTRLHKIQKAFANDDPKIRSAAISQLNILILRDFVRYGYALSGNEVTFFQSAISFVAHAIAIETETETRNSLVTIIMAMAPIANSDKSGQTSLYMVEKCKDANAIALKNFVKALAEYLISYSDTDYPKLIEGMASSTPFCQERKDLNQEILKVLCATEQFKTEIELLRELRQLLPFNDEQNSNNATLLLNISDRANCLIITRDTLALALRWYVNGVKRDIQHQNLQLQQQFLAGASFNRTNLSGSIFSGAFLIGTNLIAANLSKTNFERAILTHAFMSNSNLSGASFVHANLTNAKLRDANLADSDLSSAKVAGSTLYLASLVDNSWRYADFEGEHGRDYKLWRTIKEEFGNMDQ